MTTPASPKALPPPELPETKPAPISDERKLAALELLELAMSTPNEIADVSISWNANTGGITVHIYDGGWRSDKQWAFDETTYLDWEEDGIIPLLAKVRAHLANLTAK